MNPTERNTPYEHEVTTALTCNLCGQEPCVCGKPSCLHPLSRRVLTYKCADCGEEMPDTVRDVLGDPLVGVSFGPEVCAICGTTRDSLYHGEGMHVFRVRKE